MKKLYFANQDFHFPPFGMLPKINSFYSSCTANLWTLFIPENTGLFMYGTILVKYF